MADNNPQSPPKPGARTATGARKASAKSARTRAREFALQALYQHLVGRNDAQSIDHFTRDLAGFHKADSVHYDALLHGCIEQATELDALIAPLLDRKLQEISPIEHAVMWIGAWEFQHAADVPWRVVINECIELATELDALIAPLLDRKLQEISPIEHAVMWIGAWEFQHAPDVPWRVVINECIELAKEFGGTDGHKYVNAVLNGLAPQLRTAEVEADRAAGRARP